MDDASVCPQFYYNTFFFFCRSKGVNKIYKFDQKNPPQRRSIIVYFISTNLITFKYVLDQIHSINSHKHMLADKFDGMKSFHIIVFPTVLHSFEVILEEEGLYGVVEMHRFNWDFITIDTGVLSLEIPQIFREVFIREDTSLLSSLAQSLRILNMITKKPPCVITCGENSAKIAAMIDRLEASKTSGNNHLQEESPDVGAMIILDRNRDYSSCLMTPVTYSGLLLELFRCTSGTLQIDESNNRIQAEKLHFLKIKSKIDANKSKETITSLRLNASVDSMYQENRYKHFSEAINMLSAQAKALGMEGQNIKGMQINEMQEYVANKLSKVASQKKELFKHLILCESIVSELGANFEQLQLIEESMLYNRNKRQTFQKVQEILATDGHRFNILRHVCLLHLTCGLTTDETTSFMTNYLNAFGYQYLPIFSHLATAKLFPDLPNLSKTKILPNISLPKWQNQFQSEANKMKLLPAASTVETSETDSSDRRNPICPSYVFNGSYIPLVAQLAHSLLSANKFDDFAEKFGHNEQIVMHQYCDRAKILSVREIAAAIKRGDTVDIFPFKPRTLIFFVVGGITYAEIAACNFVERMTKAKIIIASDSIVSGSDLIEAAFS